MKEELPNICCQVDLKETVPASSADAERGFSRLKLLKTVQRTRLRDGSVTDQLTVELHTAYIETFNPMPAIDLWVNAGIQALRIAGSERDEDRSQKSMEWQRKVVNRAARAHAGKIGYGWQ